MTSSPQHLLFWSLCCKTQLAELQDTLWMKPLSASGCRFVVLCVLVMPPSYTFCTKFHCNSSSDPHCWVPVFSFEHAFWESQHHCSWNYAVTLCVIFRIWFPFQLWYGLLPVPVCCLYNRQLSCAQPAAMGPGLTHSHLFTQNTHTHTHTHGYPLTCMLTTLFLIWKTQLYCFFVTVSNFSISCSVCCWFFLPNALTCMIKCVELIACVPLLHRELTHINPGW